VDDATPGWPAQLADRDALGRPPARWKRKARRRPGRPALVLRRTVAREGRCLGRRSGRLGTAGESWRASGGQANPAL